MILDPFGASFGLYFRGFSFQFQSVSKFHPFEPDEPFIRSNLRIARVISNQLNTVPPKRVVDRVLKLV